MILNQGIPDLKKEMNLKKDLIVHDQDQNQYKVKKM
jgi:hypothetical protein